MRSTIQVQTNEHLKRKVMISGMDVCISLAGLGLTTRETSTRVDIKSQIIPLRPICMGQDATTR